MTWSIKKWSVEADAKLTDLFCYMFRDSSNGIEENTTSITGIISKCIDDVGRSSDVAGLANHNRLQREAQPRAAQ